MWSVWVGLHGTFEKLWHKVLTTSLTLPWLNVPPIGIDLSLGWARALGQWLAPLPFTPKLGVWFPVSAVWKKQNCFFPSTCESQYCGEPPWPRGNVLDLRPPGLEFRIPCLRTVSSQTSHHPQEVLLAQFSPYGHKGGLKPGSFHFVYETLGFLDFFHVILSERKYKTW